MNYATLEKRLVSQLHRAGFRAQAGLLESVRTQSQKQAVLTQLKSELAEPKSENRAKRDWVENSVRVQKYEFMESIRTTFAKGPMERLMSVILSPVFCAAFALSPLMAVAKLIPSKKLRNMISDAEDKIKSDFKANSIFEGYITITVLGLVATPIALVISAFSTVAGALCCSIPPAVCALFYGLKRLTNPLRVNSAFDELKRTVDRCLEMI